MRLSAAVIVPLAMAWGLAHAGEVTGVYEGTVTGDSGLGLNGQTMRVEITYEDTTAGSPSGNQTFYIGLVTSATVTIGTNVWTYDGSGSSSLFLSDNDVITFANGAEDRVSNFGASDFTGPDLGTGPIVFGPSLSITLSDLLPTGTPDAVDDDTVLPSEPFDPALFDDTGSISNSMRFSWGVGEFGETFVAIQVDGFSAVEAGSAPARLPLPWFAHAVLLAALAATGRRLLHSRRRAREETG